MSGKLNPRFTSLSSLNANFFHPPVLLAKLSFLALSCPPLLLFLAECPTGTGLLRPCPVSTHHRISPVTAIQSLHVRSTLPSPINHGEPLAKARLALERQCPPALQNHFSASLSPNRSPLSAFICSAGPLKTATCTRACSVRLKNVSKPDRKRIHVMFNLR